MYTYKCIKISNKPTEKVQNIYKYTTNNFTQAEKTTS